jgi:2-polyprenyl-3-methyl-5-hydroxy-6-metoxy-1,4-benzoquinol methylase
MTAESDSESLEKLRAESQAIWDANAAAYDARMGDEGNAFQRTLVFPAAERLLEVQPGQTILELACGNGAFARRLASLGANVLACDFSAGQLERARARAAAGEARISWQQVDATDHDQLMKLGEARFDSAVCNMAVMDMPVIEPMLAAMASLLKAEGRFVFSTMHPCFNSTGARLTEEARHGRDGFVIERAVKVTRYLSLGTEPEMGIAITGQPRPQHYFHRPLHVVLNAAFRNGLVLDGLEECAFPQSGGADARRSFDWENYPEIPPVLVARLRPARTN